MDEPFGGLDTRDDARGVARYVDQNSDHDDLRHARYRRGAVPRNRVIMMSARPGRVIEDIRVPSERLAGPNW